MYHINNDGIIAKCNAKSPETCPFGVVNHFEDEASAYEQLQSQSKGKYGVLPVDRVQHLKTLTSDEFQDYIMTLDISELDLVDEANSRMIDNYKTDIEKPINMLQLRRRERMIKGARDGENISEIQAKQEERRLKQIEREKRETEEATGRLLSSLEIETPESIKRWLSNYKFTRSRVQAYRGVSNQKNDKNSENGNMALYGQGLYTSTDRSEASKYGSVHKVDMNDLPANPAVFDTNLDFSQFEYELASHLGFHDKRDMTKEIEIDEILWRMGYDGVVVDKGTIIVNFDTDRNREEYNSNEIKHNKQ